jgi:hypothetical protein
MPEHPILFTAEMVRAIQAGTKTQTRRVIKPQPVGVEALYAKLPIQCHSLENYETGAPSGFGFESEDDQWRCPYGKPGDGLWVRETHYRYGRWVKNGRSPSGRQKWTFRCAAGERKLRYFDDPPDDVKKPAYRNTAWYKRPSIFMPRWASRINLTNTGVRVERVQEITDADAIAEGLLVRCGDVHPELTEYSCGDGFWTTKPRTAFFRLWDSINAERGFSVEVNPWVWPVEFGVTK